MKERVKQIEIDVKKITSLARIKITEEEEKTLKKRIEKFFEYVEKISEIETKNIEPLFNPLSRETLFHSDDVEDSFSASSALKNAPDVLDHFFKTPSIIKGASSGSKKESKPLKKSMEDEE